MRNILLIDKRNTFISDVQTHMMIENHTFSICTGISDVSNLMVAIQNFSPNEIYLAENMYDTQPDWSFTNIEVKTYSMTDEGEKMLRQTGLTYVGKVTSSLDLIDIMEKNVVIKDTQNSDNNEDNEKGDKMDFGNNNTNEQINQTTINQMPNQTPNLSPNMSGQAMSPEMMMQMMQMMQMMGINQNQMPQMNAQPIQQPQPMQIMQGYENPVSQQPVYNPMYQAMGQVQPAPQVQPVQPVMQTIQGQSVQMQTPVQQINNMQNQQEQMAAQQGVMNDIHRGDRDTKVITFFSSKGGAGTTSVAESVAIQLSRQPGTRGSLKVCLVDFDIDFGDVLSDLQLSISDESRNITAWGDNIRKQVETIVSKANQESQIEDLTGFTIDTAKSIMFSNDEILSFLQTYENTGLYVLPAPITHKDSMRFEGYEFSTILENLKASKEFDFIIIDTKSDSRDATYCALEAADMVYLVFTQDITCVNSNDSFYEALKDVNFNVNKFQYVINRVRSQSETELGTNEIEASIPYKCAGHMHEVSDMTKAHNKGVPLVFNPGNTFTKDINMFVSGITGIAVTEPKKKGLFGKRG